MTTPLVPCEACSRHVRTSEARCPFCAAPLGPDAAARAVPNTTLRLSRAATFAFGLTLVAAGCGGSSSDANAQPAAAGPAQPTSGGSAGGGDPGGTPADAGAGGDPAAADGGSSAIAPGGPADRGTVHALYGVPPR